MTPVARLRRRLRGEPPREGERPMTPWERAVVTRLASVDAPGAAKVRGSLPYLVVTGGCGCGCPSFDVRDTRYPREPHRLGGFSGGGVPGIDWGVQLWVGESGRPLSVDVFDFRAETPLPDLPDPETIDVAPN